MLAKRKKPLDLLVSDITEKERIRNNYEVVKHACLFEKKKRFKQSNERTQFGMKVIGQKNFLIIKGKQVT